MRVLQWRASDPRFATGVISPGASTAWLEQLFDTEFTTWVSEIGGGTFVDELPGVVSVDAAVIRVNTVEGIWASDYDRIFTQVVDPFETEVWCGD